MKSIKQPTSASYKAKVKKNTSKAVISKSNYGSAQFKSVKMSDQAERTSIQPMPSSFSASKNKFNGPRIVDSSMDLNRTHASQAS